MKIVLIGYMATGKSLIGELLAKRLNIPFVDLDSEIEKHLGITIPELFESKGEVFFRRKELEILKNLLGKSDSFVLATGGGTPCYGNAMDLIISNENTISIFLKASVSTLAHRLFDEKEHRPLVNHIKSIEKMQEFVGIHLFERAAYYNRAEIIIVTDEKRPEEIVSELEKHIIPKLL